MSVLINNTPRPPVAAPYRGQGFIGLTGAQAEQFLELAQSSTDIATGTFYSVNENIHGASYRVRSLMRGGVERGCVVAIAGLIIGVYAYQTQEGRDHCLKMIEAYHGHNYERFEAQKNYFQKVPADDIYMWEARYFNVNFFNSKLASALEISVELAKEHVNSEKTELLTWADAISLLRRMATDYGVYNLQVESMKMIKGVLGQASKVDTRNITEAGSEFKIALSEYTMLHVVIHEFAHIVNNVRDGQSGHGNRFREVYEELLRRYGGEANANVSLPRINLFSAENLAAEAEIQEIEGGQI